MYLGGLDARLTLTFPDEKVEIPRLSFAIFISFSSSGSGYYVSLYRFLPNNSDAERKWGGGNLARGLGDGRGRAGWRRLVLRGRKRPRLVKYPPVCVGSLCELIMEKGSSVFVPLCNASIGS
ncbi:hypothetical protein GWI33_009023 [Rhynchophorus ferrugineus]|uniref:Uncharacterized protein n=1 Tax=Rhynchophorus ferrugineus TaxID=354439 RepID=A0A834MGU1_RHYFE|nr:hypothetical protein GWI33_009023 [Rhynchophorus ferrugineus]